MGLFCSHRVNVPPSLPLLLIAHRDAILHYRSLWGNYRSSENARLDIDRPNCRRWWWWRPEVLKLLDYRYIEICYFARHAWIYIWEGRVGMQYEHSVQFVENGRIVTSNVAWSKYWLRFVRTRRWNGWCRWISDAMAFRRPSLTSLLVLFLTACILLKYPRPSQVICSYAQVRQCRILHFQCPIIIKQKITHVHDGEFRWRLLTHL